MKPNWIILVFFMLPSISYAQDKQFEQCVNYKIDMFTSETKQLTQDKITLKVSQEEFNLQQQAFEKKKRDNDVREAHLNVEEQRLSHDREVYAQLEKSLKARQIELTEHEAQTQAEIQKLHPIADNRDIHTIYHGLDMSGQ